MTLGKSFIILLIPTILPILRPKFIFAMVYVYFDSISFHVYVFRITESIAFFDKHWELRTIVNLILMAIHNLSSLWRHWRLTDLCAASYSIVSLEPRDRREAFLGREVSRASFQASCKDVNPWDTRRMARSKISSNILEGI